MPGNWRQSLLFLSTATILAVALAVGALFIARTLVVTGERLEKQSTVRLNQLLDVVESTVRIACFVEDHALAREVASGLLLDTDVRGIVLRSEQGELVRAYRPGATADASAGRIRRVIHSPFDPRQRVGEIILDPDRRELERRIGEEVFILGSLLSLQLLSLTAAIAVLILRWVVRPIKSISDRLHRMDPTRGERLDVPRGHAQTEIGRLANDINGLADRLVTTLDAERRQREQRELDERKYHAIFDNAETGIFIADRDGRIDSANPALLRLLDLPADAKGIRLGELRWAEPQHLTRLLQQCFSHDGVRNADLAFTTHGLRWLALTLSRIGDDAVQGLVSDITQRRHAEESARQQAVTDALTGVANRSGFEKRLEQAIAEHQRQHPDVAGSPPGLALMLVDLDGFKKINDALGMPAGDHILQIAANRLRSCVKSRDTVARIGGDEFAIVLPEADAAAIAIGIGERIIRLLGQSFDVDGGPLRLGASIGITLFPQDGSDLPSLLRNAELALDRARATGGSRCAFFDHGMAEAAERRQALEASMRIALRNDDYRLFYQPIVSLAENRVVGAEALIRWQHREHGMIRPDTFIPLAEETGLIIDIGLWGLETACRQLAEWQAAGHDWYVSLNVSGVQIPDGLPPRMIAEAVARCGIEPRRLILEITEGVLLKDVDSALAWLGAVRDLGFRIYLDDFGTGYSSLSYLKRFPVHTVKIDQSFVRDMSSDNSDRALVEAIVAMARSLRLDTVAEGVETAAQLELLRGIGCSSVQGYHFARPLPATEFVDTVARIDASLSS